MIAQFGILPQCPRMENTLDVVDGNCQLKLPLECSVICNNASQRFAAIRIGRGHCDYYHYFYASSINEDEGGTFISNSSSSPPLISLLFIYVGVRRTIFMKKKRYRWAVTVWPVQVNSSNCVRFATNEFTYFPSLGSIYWFQRNSTYFPIYD